MLLFVFVFGLSMDYEVFLLARISQEGAGWSTRPGRGPASERAVLRGIPYRPGRHRGGGCIAIVFLGFLLGELTAVKEIGFGMAVAVLLDVTVVRGLLLPAVMSLLGEWNWWAPAAAATAARPAVPGGPPARPEPGFAPWWSRPSPRPPSGGALALTGRDAYPLTRRNGAVGRVWSDVPAVSCGDACRYGQRQKSIRDGRVTGSVGYPVACRSVPGRMPAQRRQVCVSSCP